MVCWEYDLKMDNLKYGVCISHKNDNLFLKFNSFSI